MSENKELDGIPLGWRPTPNAPVPVVRCTAIKKDGNRCRRFSLRGTNVCIKHGGQLPDVQAHAKAVVEAAKLRIYGLTDEAIDVVYDLMQNSSADKIRLDAAKDLLDRANVKGPQEVEVTVKSEESPAEKIRRRLAETADRLNATARVIPDTDSEELVEAELEPDAVAEDSDEEL